MLSLRNYAGSRQQSYSTMKMSIFASLAKVKLNTGSIKGSNLVAVRHMIKCPDSGCNLKQYMNIKHNLLYKTWAADPRR
jgi:hypothetical protein